jgi:hypothetical protein
MIGVNQKNPSRPKLDEIASVHEQNAWLKSPRSESVTPIRDPPILADGPYDQRLRLLLAAPEWPTFAAFLRSYIENSIFRPFETEPSKTQNGWWTLTLAKDAASVNINVWRQYTLQIDFRADKTNDAISASGWVGIDAETLEAERDRGCTIPACFKIDTAKSYGNKPKIGNTRRQTAVWFNGAPLDELKRLFSSDWLLLATRTLTLDLMRAGLLPMGRARFHLPKLVDAIFSEGSTREEPEASGALGASLRSASLQ